VTKRHKLSKRGVKRADERAAVQLAKDRVRLAELSPGGAPQRPLAVESASLVEVRAKETPCAVCEARLDLKDHDAVDGLRRVRLVCKECHVERVIWFRLDLPRLN
jgi:hypothetical protein